MAGRQITLKLTEEEARLLWDAASNFRDDSEEIYGSEAPIFAEAMRKLALAIPERQVLRNLDGTPATVADAIFGRES